jgi:hypothetical protein
LSTSYSFFPHSGQNLGDPSICLPQFSHFFVNGSPHSAQNFAFSSNNETPHFGQVFGACLPHNGHLASLSGSAAPQYLQGM